MAWTWQVCLMNGGESEPHDTSQSWFVHCHAPRLLCTMFSSFWAEGEIEPPTGSLQNQSPPGSKPGDALTCLLLRTGILGPHPLGAGCTLALREVPLGFAYWCFSTPQHPRNLARTFIVSALSHLVRCWGRPNTKPNTRSAPRAHSNAPIGAQRASAKMHVLAMACVPPSLRFGSASCQGVSAEFDCFA